MTGTGRLMGIDHGLVRIGLALSDVTWTVARELAVLVRKSKAEDFQHILTLAAANEVTAFVVGLPYNDYLPEDTFSQGDKVRNWIAYFSAVTTLPIMTWDEQLTSYDAVKIARRQKRSERAPLDDLAARIMLQSYLDALKAGLAEPPPASEET